MKKVKETNKDTEIQTIDTPRTYKGWMIGKVKTPFNGTKLSAYNFKTEIFINPIYKTWRGLKSVIDALKD